MTERERYFLQDTIDILVGYDGCHTIESLKALINETRERLIKLERGNITKEDVGF